MGGGFAAPPITLASNQRPALNNLAKIPSSSSTTTAMHEKLLDKEDKTERTNLLGRSKEKPPKDKPPPKQSKFAERLRRSFRRGDHRSLECKRQEPTPEELRAKSRATPPPLPSSLPADNNNRLPFAFSHLNLPGLGLGVGLGGLGGHINPALLLDSPDECTPPEYAYQHLSSVATTNSSTSLESSCELGELSGGSQTSVYYWASMGGEVSTAAGGAAGAGTGTGGVPIDTQERDRRRLETQTSNRSDQQPINTNNTTNVTATTTASSSTAAGNNSSRSCSLTSESSSIRLTRLQNFLFKSSNESSRSCQGHSNEGFTVSSHNSSSGEWEQLGAYLSSSSGVGGGHDFHGGSFPEESTPDETDNTLPVETGSSGGGGGGGGGSYYQYTLTSPNNPFLPEITARTYHSTYDEDEGTEGGGGGGAGGESLMEDLQLDGNVTSVKYVSGGGSGARSAQLPTPSYSRAGSQESTHSEGGGPAGPTPSPASSSSSTPGRHRRKLFSLNSPTRLLHHQHQQQQSGTTSASPPSGGSSNEGGGSSSSKFNSASLVRSLNPFLPSVTSPKKAPLKQAAVTSPGSVTPDLSTKREEFLRATMKICLVVSPPNSKLQLKSKSLTHLDGLDSGVVACQHGPPGIATTTTTTTTAAGTTHAIHATNVNHHGLFATTGTPGSLGRQPNVAEKSETAGVCPSPSSNPQPPSQQAPCQPSTHPPPNQSHPAPTIYTQAPQIVRRTPSLMLSLSPTLDASTTTTTMASSACFGTGHSSAGSFHQHQHHHHHSHQSQLASSGTTGTISATHAIPSSKHFQFAGEAAASSSATLSPYSTTTPNGGGLTSPAGGSTSSSATVKKKSSFMKRKKPLLTRSEVSSSEFFSVSFCLDSSQQQHPDEEFIPATKGVTLLNALSHALRRRNISFSQITITDNNPTPSFLDAGPSPVPVSVDEQTDVESLAGHHLCITERGSNRKPLQKAASFGSRQPPPRLLPSVSTEETSESGVAAGKQIKQRWSSIFGIKNPQQSQLCELLNSYGRNGVPQRADGLNFEHPDLVNSLAYLQDMHKSWRDFVESSTMSESEVKIQTAIWELVTTEVYYIHALQTVTDLFLACLEAVQEERLLIDVDQARLFSNVRAVCEANIKFWTLWLYPMVAHSVITHEPLRCAFFQEGFIAFASIFAPYKIYCAEQSTCQFYCKELNQNNPLFTSYLAWCESQKMCNRLRLADIVVRPMQRLTKYSLLLAAIKKHMSDVEEIEAIDVMIHSVENFVGSVNNHLTMRQENERLKGVMVRIESYDVVDTNNEMLDKLIKQHSQMFDLCAPMRGCPSYHVRHLFMEGDHKFKDNLGKSDVHCFLLTDLLLVCKTIAKRGLGALKVIRQPYLTDQLIVQLAANNTLNCVYLNEFQVATTAFTLQCTEAKNWYDALWRAKTIYQRLKRGAGGVGGISGGGGGGSGSGTVGGDSFRFGGSGTSGGTSGGTADSLGVRKSPMNSSIGSHVSSANNSHSGSVEWNDSRNISVDFEKTNSVSSDEGSSIMTGNHGVTLKGKQQLISGLHKAKMGMIGPMGSKSANTLSVQPMNHLGQSLPNLNMHHSHTVPLRRGMAFSTSTKNPPLRKTRNVTSQNSINWHQIPATPTPPSPRSQHQSPGNVVCMQKSLPLLVPSEGGPGPSPPPLLHKQLSHQAPLPTSNSHHNQSSTETDV
ncbi:pleckstrin homology domain-containing family G member 5 isoform X2 [Drosophila kikkawai]|uniref:Pleckstrin homology domain-containing family G member 5 isoform X2 n=1 Tax=Drosophila kikkawai TaxID=30033 RepID=A0ABM4GE73_DROKI